MATEMAKANTTFRFKRSLTRERIETQGHWHSIFTYGNVDFAEVLVFRITLTVFNDLVTTISTITDMIEHRAIWFVYLDFEEQKFVVGAAYPDYSVNEMKTYTIDVKSEISFMNNLLYGHSRSGNLILEIATENPDPNGESIIQLSTVVDPKNFSANVTENTPRDIFLISNRN